MNEHPIASSKVLRDGVYWFRKSNVVEKDEKFDSYVERATSFYCLQLLPVENQISSETFYSCTCPHYWKYATCKHSLGFSVWKGCTQIPGKWKVNSIEQVRKRGRPALVGNCLEK